MVRPRRRDAAPLNLRATSKTGRIPGTLPTIHTVLKALQKQGIGIAAKFDDPENYPEFDDPDWTQFELTYKAENAPIPVECDRCSGKDFLASEEVAEFLDELDNLEDSAAKDKVVQHLRATRYIVCCRLLSDIDDDGYEAKSAFLDYFVQSCGGMVYADLEGFYDGPDLILPLE